MIHPTEEEKQEFIEKVLPIVQDLLTELGLSFKARYLNLACGREPRTKREAAIKETILRRTWAKYPGADYPKMCAPFTEDLRRTIH